MKFKKKISSLIICATLVLGSINFAFADSSKVVTLGANLTSEQKQKMLDYFGVKGDEAVILEVNNQEERKYLQGVATEAQIGTKTFSCSYVEPTTRGKGINVKTANLTWVTSSMIATTLSTAGLEDANVVVASLFPVSGTGGLTGVMKAFEDATGEKLDEEKKELASEELVTTGDLGQDIGQDKATGVINDIKTQVIKNGTSDVVQIADTINNITNNYNITLTAEQQKQIEDLMLKISKQDYDYNKIKETLENVSDNVDQNLSDMGESIKDSGILDTIKGWFTSIGDWFKGLVSSNDKDLGILENTNDSLLGDGANIDATDKEAIKLPSSDEVEGFFAKIWNWFTGLFNNDNNNTENSGNQEDSNQETNNEIIPSDAEENTHFENNSDNEESAPSKDDNSTENNKETTNNSENLENPNDNTTQNSN
ncbi:DUF1002 domain-containing protein [Romboutsia weinsteinii]|uniref:DUF1002 domain-containing protein n=1 Tax=Romboutsia weinsteinii TaxID=2020949 RepID=A0A371IZK7_9FIRM|nr:DUF1002 domain-containing protein [Romboutsia weinsteinii]RDY26001.1 DUF1002 domain-containing protein [Romboutsia weinsteinii]